MKFKTGDLVHVYGFDSVNAMTILRRKIVGIDTDGSLETDAGEFVHPKQCRLLKKKERRRIWVNPEAIQDIKYIRDSLKHVDDFLAKLHEKDFGK